MTTHCAAWVPGAANEPGRLFWASDRKYTRGDGVPVSRFFRPEPKAYETEHLWIAGAARTPDSRLVRREACSCTTAVEVADVVRVVGKESPYWNGDEEFLVADAIGLYLLPAGGELNHVRDCTPWAIGSGREFALGAVLALLPAIPTARTDWQGIVRRAVLVAAECDEGTEGVESGVWRPGPTVYQFEAEDVAVPA